MLAGDFVHQNSPGTCARRIFSGTRVHNKQKSQAIPAGSTGLCSRADKPIATRKDIDTAAIDGKFGDTRASCHGAVTLGFGAASSAAGLAAA
jgi:hypothetical protein